MDGQLVVGQLKKEYKMLKIKENKLMIIIYNYKKI